MRKDYKPYSFTEYHARRSLQDPKLWVVVEVILDRDDRVGETKVISDLMKRSRAEAIVRLLRSNQRES